MRHPFALALFSLALVSPTHAQQTVSVELSGNLTHPAICDGVIYTASDNGKLYAIGTTDGSAVPGFPVDVKAAVGDGSFPDGQSRSGGRVGVYYGSMGKAIYLETSKHGVVKVWPNGTIAWINKLNGTGSPYASSTPAVTPNGEVIAEMKTSDNVFLVKLKESDGTLMNTSPPLAQLYLDYISAPAVVGNEIYVTVSPYPAAGGDKNVTVLNLSDLSVRASIIGSSKEEAPPYVRGGSVYFGSSALMGATVYKLNATTLNPDDQFGIGSSPPTAPGVTRVLSFDSIGTSEVSASPTSADRDPAGTIYASVGLGQVARAVAIDAATGTVRVLYAAAGMGSMGLVVSSKNVIAFGVEKTLQTFGVDGGHNASYTLPGYPSRPCYDPTTNRFFVTTMPDSTGTSYLLGFDSP